MSFPPHHLAPRTPTSVGEEYPSEGVPMHPFVPNTPVTATPPAAAIGPSLNTASDVAAVQQKMVAMQAEMQQMARTLDQLRAEVRAATVAAGTGEKAPKQSTVGEQQPTNTSIVFHAPHLDVTHPQPPHSPALESEGAIWEQFLAKFATPFSVLRTSILLFLVCVSIYVSYSLVMDWIETGQYPSTTFSQVDVSALGLPSAGMIPAPYATDANCFQPTPKSCVAFFGESGSPGVTRQQFDCLPWLSSVNVSSASRGGSMTIYLLDGTKAAASGYYFTSILDYVQYTFEFSPLCSQPYLWVFVSGDTALANLDPSESMQTLAQSSFLIQGGQYVMVAFQLQQDVDLGGNVLNTTLLTASSMAVKDFNASLALEATAVFRPASFKVQTNTAQPGQSFWEMIANLGGWIGLFLGFSLIQIIDAAELLHEWFKGRGGGNEAQGGGGTNEEERHGTENAVMHNCAASGCTQNHLSNTHALRGPSQGYLHHQHHASSCNEDAHGSATEKKWFE